jgi:alkylation response protein AidB-like acyl-CoA dehydrogenase
MRLLEKLGAFALTEPGHGSDQLYCLQIGRLAGRGQLTDTIAGLAKLNNTRKARQIALRLVARSAATESFWKTT